MLGNSLSPLYQRWLVEPVAKKLIHRCRPNHITYFACWTGVTAGLILMAGFPLLTTLLLLLSGYCDSLDGAIARLTHNASPTGAVLDIVSDRLVEFVMVLGLFSIDALNRGWFSLLMLGGILICVTSFLVVGIFAPKDSVKSFHYSPGLVERTEAFIFFIAMIWLPHYFNTLAGIFTGLLFLTAALRIKQFVNQQQESK